MTFFTKRRMGKAKRLSKKAFRKTKAGFKKYGKASKKLAAASANSIATKLRNSAYCQMHGMRSVNAKLATLEKASTRKRVLRKGIGAGTTVILKAAKQNVHKGEGPAGGTLKKALGRKTKTYPGDNGAVVGIVGPRKGFATVIDGKRIDPVKYAHIEEHGRAVVTIRKKKVLSDGTKIYGVKVKEYRGRPFLYRAASQNTSATQAAMARACWTGIAAELQKVGGSD